MRSASGSPSSPWRISRLASRLEAIASRSAYKPLGPRDVASRWGRRWEQVQDTVVSLEEARGLGAEFFDVEGLGCHLGPRVFQLFLLLLGLMRFNFFFG